MAAAVDKYSVWHFIQSADAEEKEGEPAFLHLS